MANGILGFTVSDSCRFQLGIAIVDSYTRFSVMSRRSLTWFNRGLKLQNIINAFTSKTWIFQGKYTTLVETNFIINKKNGGNRFRYFRIILLVNYIWFSQNQMLKFLVLLPNITNYNLCYVSLLNLKRQKI